ncbi:MAG: hypothetical protein HBSIN02_06530 [Bacteroidia bacterium]|nr:MAG: hypothetical protein HBSIN02_06530 [Bacteroidia bacterium]
MRNSTDKKQWREVIESWAASIRAGDMVGILANHTKDILIFDVPEPLQSKGLAAYKKTWNLFFNLAFEGL